MSRIDPNPYIGGFLRTTQLLAKQSKYGAGGFVQKPTSYVSPEVQDQIDILSGPKDSLAQALTKGVSEQKFTSIKDYGAYIKNFFKTYRSGQI